MNKKALAAFIDGEIRSRQISMSQFAQLVGVAHTTISRVLTDDKITPSLEFLEKLAKATNTDVCTLVAMLIPDATQAKPTARVLAQRIARLSEEDQRLLDRFLLTLIQSGGNGEDHVR